MAETIFTCHSCGHAEVLIAGADDLTAKCLACGDQMERYGPVDYRVYFEMERKSEGGGK